MSSDSSRNFLAALRNHASARRNVTGMSWALAADWAIMAGSLFLTVGTGAQARANLNEYLSAVHVNYRSAWYYYFRGASLLYALLTGRSVERKMTLSSCATAGRWQRYLMSFAEAGCGRSSRSARRWSSQVPSSSLCSATRHEHRAVRRIGGMGTPTVVTLVLAWLTAVIATAVP